jgi:hypothetical protein
MASSSKDKKSLLTNPEDMESATCGPTAEQSMESLSIASSSSISAERASLIFYMTLFGVHRPKSTAESTLWIIWHYIFAVVFFGYILALLFQAISNIMFGLKMLWWVLYLVMVVKGCALRRAVMETRRRLHDPSDRAFYAEFSEAIILARRYFVISWILCLIAIVLFCSIAYYYNDYSLTLWLVFVVLGQFTFCGYTASVVLYFVADARVARQSILDMIVLADAGQLNPDIYSNSEENIRIRAEACYKYDSMLIGSMGCSLVAVMLLALIFRTATHGYSTLYAAAFISYVFIVICGADVIFLIFVAPECAKVNDLNVKLHRTLAMCKWHTACEEQFRHDTLHRIIARPIQFKIAGLHLTTTGTWNRLVGLLSAIVITFVRVVFSEIIKF